MGSCDKDNDNTPESPLSVVTMNIIPDYSDGSVGGVKVSSFNGEYTYSFDLGVTVTPEKFAKELAESDGYVRKAVFAPVATKGSTEGGFSLTPSQVTYYRTPDLSNILKIGNKPPKGLMLSDFVCNFAMSVIALEFECNH